MAKKQNQNQPICLLTLVIRTLRSAPLSAPKQNLSASDGAQKPSTVTQFVVPLKISPT